jgi:ubiquinone/menaquinone biosynthesis C-methylase UbiE
MFLSPAQIVENLNLKKGDVVADFGCGAGVYAFVISKLVGDRGKVYAVDIHKEILEKINHEADKMNIINIETILADLEKKVEIESYSCDCIILSNILSLVGDIDRVLEEAKRILKPDGIYLIIDWRHTEEVLSLKRGHILKEEEITAVLAKNNIFVKKHLPAGKYHYAFTAV